MEWKDTVEYDNSEKESIYPSTRKPEDYDILCEQKRVEVKRAVRDAKNEVSEKFGEKMSIEFKENQKLFYRTFNQLIAKKEYIMLFITYKEGNVIIKEVDQWKRQELTKTDEISKEEKFVYIITQEEIHLNEQIKNCKKN